MNYLKKKPVLTWTLIIAHASLIFVFSSMPHPPQPIEAEGTLAVGAITTFEHILEYSVLGFLLLAGFGAGESGLRERVIPNTSPTFLQTNIWKFIPPLLVIILATIYGITDEIHQSFVPNRDSSILDVLADCIGAFLGVLIGNLRY